MTWFECQRNFTVNNATADKPINSGVNVTTHVMWAYHLTSQVLVQHDSDKRSFLQLAFVSCNRSAPSNCRCRHELTHLCSGRHRFFVPFFVPFLRLFVEPFPFSERESFSYVYAFSYS